MISADIRKQIKSGEGPGVAFIADPSAFDEVAATVCAFLNSRGGVVFVGVDGEGVIVGVGADPEAARRALEMRLQSAIVPKALFTLSVDTEEDHPIITVEVPQGRDVPYTTGGTIYGRRGTRNVVIDREDLRQMVQGRSVEAERWERRPAVGLDFEDLDEAEIDVTVAEAREFGRLDFPGGDTDRALRELNLIVSGGYTQGCDILFARRPSARHPQARVRFIHFESSKTGSSFLADEWLQGPLVQVYNALIERIGAHVRVQAYFPAGKHAREDRFNYSIEALREGIVNALAHRDYASFSGGVTVSVYPNRIEIWNSGRLPQEITVADLKRPHPSIPTNPDITHVLYLRRLMERIGRGTQKIVTACGALGAKPPKWQDAPSGVTLTIFSAGDAEGARLNPRQAQLIERLRPGDTFRITDYLREQEVSERQARRDLSELEEGGFLLRTGQARATTYQRTERTV